MEGLWREEETTLFSLVVTVYKIPSVIEHPTGMLLRCGMCVEADIAPNWSWFSPARRWRLRWASGQFQISGG